ncbi:hypothetical protein Bca4012_053726 [Brassica carinata]
MADQVPKELLEKTLEETSTWAVAVWLIQKQKGTLYEALEKIKAGTILKARIQRSIPAIKLEALFLCQNQHPPAPSSTSVYLLASRSVKFPPQIVCFQVAEHNNREEGEYRPYSSSVPLNTSSRATHDRSLASTPRMQGRDTRAHQQEESLISNKPPQPTFQERRDRHGNLFGDRVGTKQTRNPPPDRTAHELDISKQKGEHIATQEAANSYASPPYSKNRELTGKPLHKGRDLFSQRNVEQWRPKQTQPSQTPAVRVQNNRDARPVSLHTNEDSQSFPGNNQTISTETIMEELQEATRQYLSCPDPVEAAARRQRVHFSEANGELEETSARILAASQPTRQTPLQVVNADSNPVTPPPLHEENINSLLLPDPSLVSTPSLREEDDPVLETHYSETPRPEGQNIRETDTERPTRLKSVIISPTNEGATTQMEATRQHNELEDEETLGDFQNKVRKSSIRPSKRKSSRSSPIILRGASSKKRRLSQIQNSPRRTLGSSTPHSSKGSTKTSKAKERAGTSTAGSNPPIQLMLLGFISLLLTVAQTPISKICISKSVGSSMRPCSAKDIAKKEYKKKAGEKFLLELAESYIPRRSLATKGVDKCALKGQVAFVSAYGIHQLHIFIFVLAVVHVIYCIVTYALGKSKMKKWKQWEDDTKTLEYEYSNDQERFRQFFGSVTEVDYKTLRRGFIMALVTGSGSEKTPYDFFNYIQRSLEKDFKTVVEIRILEKGDVVRGAPVVQPGDDLFWFDSPGVMLFLIHLVLFSNAFQLAFFAWSSYEFGFSNCFHKEPQNITIRIVVGLLVQILCSYVTLPLYALVIQMGTRMKPTVFNKRVSKMLNKWHHKAQEETKHGRHSESNTPTHDSSPIHLLHNSNNRSVESFPNPSSSHSDHLDHHQFYDPESQHQAAESSTHRSTSHESASIELPTIRPANP